MSDPLLYYLCLLAWVAIGVLAFFKACSRGSAGVGLGLAFVINMAVLHFFGAAVSALPWYRPLGGWWLIETGFAVSTLGFVAFAVGCYWVAPWFTPGVATGGMEFLPMTPPTPVRTRRVYLLTGVGCYVAMLTGAGRIPSATAILATGFYFVLVAICLAMWDASVCGDRRRFFWLLASTALLPLFTVVTSGFLGFGLGYAIVVSSFFAVLYGRRRWRMLLVAVPLGFFALSVFVTYMRDRTEIRKMVWGGYSYEDRLKTLATTAQTLEWFDPVKPTHLLSIDLRLNQNFLVGSAVSHLGYTKNYAYGDTLWMSVLALVPRAVWPTKPVVAGSMGLVDTYAGIPVPDGTSIGMGLIFEFFINFGRVGVAVGMLVVGVLVGVADRKAGNGLRTGVPTEFAKWFVIGIVLQNVGGSLVEIAPGLIAAVLLATVAQKFIGASAPDVAGEPVVGR